MLREFRVRFRCAAASLVVMAAIGVAGIAGCGIKGPLKPPPQAQVPSPGAPPAEQPPPTPAPPPTSEPRP